MCVLSCIATHTHVPCGTTDWPTRIARIPKTGGHEGKKRLREGILYTPLCSAMPGSDARRTRKGSSVLSEHAGYTCRVIVLSRQTSATENTEVQLDVRSCRAGALECVKHRSDCVLSIISRLTSWKILVPRGVEGYVCCAKVLGFKSGNVTRMQCETSTNLLSGEFHMRL